jgi:hypothetical protein
MSTSITEPFYGLYKGLVVNNKDPEGLGRVTATIPQVFGNNTTASAWAFPCVPVGYPGSFLPVPNSGVWIMFEGGDVDYPIWGGTWQESATSTTTINYGSTTVPVISSGVVTTGTYILVDPNGTGEAGIGFKFSKNATDGANAYPVYDDNGVFIGGVGSTGGYKVQGDRIQVTPNIYFGPFLGLDGQTNPPSIIMPGPDYGGSRIWFFQGTPAVGWVSGVTQVGDLGYNMVTFQWMTCTVSGGGLSAGTWVNGFGINQIGKQVAYDPVTFFYACTCAVANTWYPAGLNTGGAPTVTLPDDGRFYKVEWTGPWWNCSTNNLLCAAALGTSTSNIIANTYMEVNSFNQGFVPVIIPQITGSGQTIGCYTLCGNGTPTITFGAGSTGPSTLAAYCVG